MSAQACSVVFHGLYKAVQFVSVQLTSFALYRILNNFDKETYKTDYKNRTELPFEIFADDAKSFFSPDVTERV